MGTNSEKPGTRLLGISTHRLLLVCEVALLYLCGGYNTSSNAYVLLVLSLLSRYTHLRGAFSLPPTEPMAFLAAISI